MMGFQDWLRTHEQDGELHTYLDPNPAWEKKPGRWGITVTDTVWTWEEDEGGLAPTRSFSTRADAENALYGWLMRGDRHDFYRIVPGVLPPDRPMDVWERCDDAHANMFVIMPGRDDEEIASFDTRREAEAFILGLKGRG
jgi:hypothetical protein